MQSLEQKLRELRDENASISEQVFLKELSDAAANRPKRRWAAISAFGAATLALIAAIVFYEAETLLGNENACAIENNVVVMQLAQPIVDCSRACIDSIPRVPAARVSRDEFARKYAYSGHPIVVTGAARNWSALANFGHRFFRDVYRRVPNSVELTESECQFFEYNTDMESLSEFLGMTEKRASLKEDSWYIGWSNCDSGVDEIMREYYERPHFLPPADEESSELTWIFMGGTGPGAFLHMDHVDKVSWQAQVSGTKSWLLVPPFECEDVCKSVNVTVEAGDIIVVDTNFWYHATYVHPGNMSIAIGSEFD